MEQITFDKVPEAIGKVLDWMQVLQDLITQQQPQAAELQDQLLTIEQAGELLNLSVPTIYGLVSKRSIPHCKKGKRLYFSRIELLEWVRSGRQATTADIQVQATNYLNRKNK